MAAQQWSSISPFLEVQRCFAGRRAKGRGLWRQARVVTGRAGGVGRFSQEEVVEGESESSRQKHPERWKVGGLSGSRTLTLQRQGVCDAVHDGRICRPLRSRHGSRGGSARLLPHAASSHCRFRRHCAVVSASGGAVVCWRHPAPGGLSANPSSSWENYPAAQPQGFPQIRGLTLPVRASHGEDAKRELPKTQPPLESSREGSSSRSHDLTSHMACPNAQSESPWPPPTSSKSTVPSSSRERKGSEEGNIQEPSSMASLDRTDSALPNLPSAQDGFNWFCISIILLVALVDFSPVGPALQSSGRVAAPALLAAIQWLFFVAPTIGWAGDCGLDRAGTFNLAPPQPRHLGAGLVGGAALWALVAALLAAKAQLLPLQQLPVLPSQSELAQLQISREPGFMSAFTPTSFPESLMLSGERQQQHQEEARSGDRVSDTVPFGLPPLLWDVLWIGLSPAIAEELLFHGFLLTALSQRFSRLDSVLLSAAMFAAFHLSASQFFPTMVLGIATGALVVRTGSVFPAMALHFSNNVAALTFGALTTASASAAAAIVAAGDGSGIMAAVQTAGGAGELPLWLVPAGTAGAYLSWHLLSSPKNVE